MTNTIKPTELRYGSLVCHGEGKSQYKVLEIKNYGKAALCRSAHNGVEITFPIEKLSGIPITKELLIEAGFDLIFSVQYSHHLLKSIIFDISNKVFYYEGDCYRFDQMSTEIKYVHQLQNAFKVFTGEELTFKK